MYPITFLSDIDRIPSLNDSNSFQNLSVITIKECVEVPLRVHSSGLWNYGNSGNKLSSLPQLELQMMVIYAITHAFHSILKRYGVPQFTSQIIAGAILGPSLLGRFKLFKILFDPRSQETIGMLGFWGHTLFLFLSGVKMDIKVLKRMGRNALYTGLACILFPLLVGLSLGVCLKNSWLTREEANSLPFMTAFQSLTPFPVVVYLLESLKILNSELGQLGLSAALVTDVIAMLLITLVELTMIGKEYGKFDVILGGVTVVVFYLIVIFVFRPAMVWVVKQTPKGRPVKSVYIHTIMLLMFMCALLTHSIKFSVLFGPTVLGLAVPDGPPLGSAIVNKFNCFTEQVLLPVYVATCIMRVDLYLIMKLSIKLMASDIVLLSATFAAKMVACLIPFLYSKMPRNDALSLALILSIKGGVHLGFYSFYGDSQIHILSEKGLALSIVAMLIDATIAPILVKYLYDPSRKYAGYKKRDIMHNRRNAELRILVCIHKPNNIPTVIKLLEASGPTKQRPLTVYVLHLIKLTGRATPIFISHQMQKKSLTKTSYSENVIVAFNNLKQDNLDGISQLHVFTAISPQKFMHEDVCTLALEKLTSLIVLPFHRRWSLDGFVESEDYSTRTLNSCVLELAPCSVGILVDRGRSTVPADSSYSVAMIFIGGSDDQEALTFAKRMANDEMNINLTVVHFVASGSEEIRDWEDLLDFEVLKDVKLNNVSGGYVTYIEEMVKDGPQTALLIHSMIDEHDLIVVGRRHNVVSPQTSGLAEWSEFPELGIIGDLLASSDNNTKTSILVVQQQHHQHQRRTIS